MINIHLLKESPSLIKTALENRGVKIDIDYLLELDDKRRNFLQKVEELRAEKNRVSSGDISPEGIEKAKELKEELKKIEEEFNEIETEFNKIFKLIPNIPFEDVPVGKDEKDNVVVRKWGEIPQFKFQVKDHLELGKNLDLIDMERAAKVSGSRFSYLKNEATLLEFALIKFILDFLNKKGFIPVIPPILIKEEMMRSMGYIDTEDDLAERYHLKKDKLFLTGTSEQAVGPMHQGEVLDELPKRYISFSTCLREEAGSYGKDTKGIFRLHQFDKLEMFSFVKDSRKELLFLIELQEEIVKKLGLPYQLVRLCTGDLARPSAETYDIEVWIPSQEKYRETHSASNCTDFQSRRLNIKHREGNKVELVHTLNATGLAIERILIAIFENYQQKNGRILIPKVLRKYLGFKYIG